MIASTPVARWSWGQRGHDVDLVAEATRRLQRALSALSTQGLADAAGARVAVEMVAGASDQGPAQVAGFALGGVGAGAADRLAEQIRERFSGGSFVGLELGITVGGILTDSNGSGFTPGLFDVSVSVYEEYFHVGLETYSDSWMLFDLRGREQQAVFEANAPRLATALAEISEALGLQTEPEEPTHFGIATKAGVENHFEDADGAPSDRWGRFEIPQRNEIFSRTPTSPPGYARQASGRIRYVPARGDQEVLGYLWASDTEGAASFAPCDHADLRGYRAGLVWLARLQEAYDRGLSPLAALTEMERLPGERLAGQAVGAEAAEVAEFWMLLDLTED